ncbi:MAG: hypothetical protein UW32_C0001G0148 [Candidatus Wolfebacteria bacterium GW2011_GWE2_44_13]|uniref:Uncharacterized protein n=1 Tax=Candidatus Wolfebacteria bacterium GW2011_GWE2_44_13 TaxID=1619017 RepID=A0A0G1H831_9BACT|nr:MAG: hypothetical protein UW32_C0001G0148 [Candidatus Wolfebacteria bacterium GW2011_GWE2_44_13]
MKNSIKNTYFPLVGVGILLIGSVVVGTVFAWTNPSDNPPAATPVITTTNGNIGIAKATPAYSLDIYNASDPRVRISNGTYNYFLGNANMFLSGALTNSFGISSSNGITFSGNNTTGSHMTLATDGSVGIGTASTDTNYKLTISGKGVKAESANTQPAGYFNNTGGGPAITAGTGGITLGGVNQTAWPMPAPAAFRGALVYTSSPWPTLGAATFTTIPYAYEKYDTDAIHNTVTNPARLTVPAGVSRVRLVFKLAVGSNPTSAGSLSVQIKKNGTTNNTDSAEATFPLATTYRPSVMVSSPVTNVIPGDYFEAVVYNSTAALTGVVSWFGMEVIE